MTETEKPETPAPPAKPGCRKRKIAALAVTAVTLGAIAALLFCPWFIRLHAGAAYPDMAAIQQRLAGLEDRTQRLDSRMQDLAARVELNATAPAETTEPPAAKQSAAAIARLQSDLVALSAAMSALQAEVKQTGAHAAYTQAATRASLAAAIAFIPLREAARAGEAFSAELAAMREAGKNDGALQELLGRLEPYAAKPAPAPAELRDELIALEAPAAQAIAAATAQGWREKVLAGLKGLISIRSLHGGAGGALTAMESDLAHNNVPGALEEYKELPPEAQQVLSGWRAKAEARQAIDDALHAIAAHFIALAAPAAGEQP